MDDFFIATNGALSHTFADQQIEIHQVQVKNLNTFAAFAEPLKSALTEYSVDAVKAIVESHVTQVMGLCSVVTSLDVKLFSEHVENHEAVAELVLKIIETNNEYFKKEGKRSTQTGKEWSWFDSFQYLITQGHKHDDIMNMSHNAFVIYLKAAQRNEMQKLKSIAVATRVAQHAKNNGFEKYLKQLDS